MYTLEIRIYQPPGEIRAYAELYGDRHQDPEPVATAHRAWVAGTPELNFDHILILDAISEVCVELAENLTSAYGLWRADDF